MEIETPQLIETIVYHGEVLPLVGGYEAAPEMPEAADANSGPLQEDGTYHRIGPDTDIATDEGTQKLGELSDGARCELLAEDNEEAEMLNEQLRERIASLEAKAKRSAEHTAFLGGAATVL